MTILEMSFGGAVLIAAVLLLRRALLYRVPKWTFLLLWLAALCRLLIPFTLPSRFSVYTGAARAVRFFEENTPAVSSEARPPAIDPGIFREDGRTVPTVPAVPAAAPEKEPASPLSAVYLTGASLCGLFFAAAYLRGLRRFRGAKAVTSGFLTRWQREHPTLLPVEIKSCAAVNAPLAYGLLRPVVLLPQNTDWSDEDRLACVLTHEYIHIRRGDLGWKLLLTAALCLHWFNPLVWAMYFHANRDLELACDEAAVRALGLDSRKRYACSLLSAAESGFSPVFITYAAKNHMEERIRAIMKMKKTSVAAILTAAALVAGVTVVFATSKTPGPKGSGDLPQTVQNDPQSKPNPAPALPGRPETDGTDFPTQHWDSNTVPVGAQDSVGTVNTPAPGTREPAAPVSENRWGVPDGELPQWAEYTAASFEDAEELGKYLEAVHGLYPGDYTPGSVNGVVTVQISYREREIRERLPDGVYPVNSKGETYGTALDGEVIGYDPDLIWTGATNGAEGYVLNRDLTHAGYPGSIDTPEDAMAYMAWLETQPSVILIPVYDVDRNHVVGYTELCNGRPDDITPEEEMEMVADQLRRIGYGEEEIAQQLESLKAFHGWD